MLILEEFSILYKKQSGWFRTNPIALKVNPRCELLIEYFRQRQVPIDYSYFKT